MVDFGLEQLDAYQVVSQAVGAPLANVVEVNDTSVAKMAKRGLAQREVLRGHRREVPHHCRGVPQPASRSAHL